MTKRKGLAVAFATTVFVTGFFAGNAFQSWSVARAQANRVFEIRTYTPEPGKMEALQKRFRDHTLRIFKKHNIDNVIYLNPQDAPLKDTALIYIIAHPNREAAKKNWAEFGADPEWQKVAQESGVGRVKIESVFADPTDYSPMK